MPRVRVRARAEGTERGPRAARRRRRGRSTPDGDPRGAPRGDPLPLATTRQRARVRAGPGAAAAGSPQKRTRRRELVSAFARFFVDTRSVSSSSKSLDAAAFRNPGRPANLLPSVPEEAARVPSAPPAAPLRSSSRRSSASCRALARRSPSSSSNRAALLSSTVRALSPHTHAARFSSVAASSGACSGASANALTCARIALACTPGRDANAVTGSGPRTPGARARPAPSSEPRAARAA